MNTKKENLITYWYSLVKTNVLGVCVHIFVITKNNKIIIIKINIINFSNLIIDIFIYFVEDFYLFSRWFSR